MVSGLGLAGPGRARRGRAWRGMAGRGAAGHGGAWRGVVRPEAAGPARHTVKAATEEERDVRDKPRRPNGALASKEKAA